MLSPEILQEISRRITADLHPDQIILFGSHAWGSPGAESDVDLLVIVPDSDETPHRRAVKAHRALRGLTVPCDIIVRTRAEIAAINQVRSSLLFRALTEGKRLDA
ncbi:nucleotidyltransferase domain-containing protein [Thauera sp. 2A1]|uniref:nucleotidyltransferase domain-containing protein n=1 Tax=Thauera sp. 2A1 TaxID=2570191 RepID=UPI0012914CEE|nr:nucleotidyltransferase domain-containing protein [Thauera sp. 2A1]KAI5916704.1 nucleotidyltransferase domain-containing protein [Thauera sp. 2A1]